MSLVKRQREIARSHTADPTDRISKKMFRGLRRPPKDELWIWLTHGMLRSELWYELPLAARRCLDRLMLEHLEQGLHANGQLIVTYDQFEKCKIRRESISDAIGALEYAGFIRIDRGKFEAADRKRPNIYTLTWLPVDIRSSTNDFKKVTVKQLRNYLEARRKHRGRHRALREKYGDGEIADNREDI